MNLCKRGLGLSKRVTDAKTTARSSIDRRHAKTAYAAVYGGNVEIPGLCAGCSIGLARDERISPGRNRWVFLQTSNSEAKTGVG